MKDINAGQGSSYAMGHTNVNGTVFFRANNGLTGAELWKSDGTDAGTVQVKDIFPGQQSSWPAEMTVVNGTLFFVANDGLTGGEVWKTDGTAAGTVQVKDIRPGPNSSSPLGLTNVDGTLFFAANDGLAGRELWKSDGTAAGTVQVKDIRLGGDGSFPVPPAEFTNVKGTLFFRASDGLTGNELWKSDGTAAGTMQVKDISPGPFGSFPSTLTDVNGTLFFAAFDELAGRELWKSDGTALGTMQVKDIRPGLGTSFLENFTNFNGTLFFSATDHPDAPGGDELWKSDGTAAGTMQVKDIYPGPNGSHPADLTNFNGTLFFRAGDERSDDGLLGHELWKSDGTAVGTVRVKDIIPGVHGSTPAGLTNVNGTLFFSAWDSPDREGGYGLWKSDGTAAGTVQVKEHLSPHDLTDVNGTLFFSAHDDAHGIELWKTLPPIR